MYNNLLLIYNTVHITDYFQFIFSMLPQDFSNQPVVRLPLPWQVLLSDPPTTPTLALTQLHCTHAAAPFCACAVAGPA